MDKLIIVCQKNIPAQKTFFCAGIFFCLLKLCIFADMGEYIQHKGVIAAIKNGIVDVRIEQAPACAACHAKEACTLLDKQNKIIEVSQSAGSFAVGDEVWVLEKRTLGMKAVLYSYVLPLFIMFLILILLKLMNKSDIFAGAASLAVLVPYYMIFFLLKDKLKKTFVFTIQKVD